MNEEEYVVGDEPEAGPHFCREEIGGKEDVHVVSFCRSGAVGKPFLLRTLAIVVSLTDRPRFMSAPAIWS